MNESISNYFEILSHPVRFAILKSLDIHMMNFGEILKDVSDLGEDIGSSKLNFHLKKLVDFGIITKTDKLYSISEFGLKFLSLIQNFEIMDDQSNVNFEVIKESSNKSSLESDNEPVNISTNLDSISKKTELPIIQRPNGLPLLVSIFEYFEGKNYDYMEENFTLNLPDPISENSKPKEWIKHFSRDFYLLLQNEKSNDWLIDRLLKLGYGTRGLQDYGLMDASISVPPIDSLFTKLKNLLESRGKAGLYAKTGMGKSRIALYIASYWLRTYKTPVLYLQNPHYLNDDDVKKLQTVLTENVAASRKSPKWLIIIEDAHLCNEKQLEYLQKIIGGANNKTYSIFVSFTDIPLLKDAQTNVINSNSQLEKLKQELIPLDSLQELDLKNHWIKIRPYFIEWLKFISADVLFELLPKADFNNNVDMFQSPWSLVVSLGFLKHSLNNLIASSETNNFSIILYYSLAQIYIMRGEKNLGVSSFLLVINNFFSLELQELFGPDWKNKIIDMMNSWTLPTVRLIPPFTYVQNHKTLVKDALISFYHLQWANEVCTYLEASLSGTIDFTNLFIHIFPFIHQIWSILEKKELINFNGWLRERVTFEFNDQGDVRLTSFKLSTNECKKVENFTIPEEEFKKLKQSQLVNWMFIKSIIMN